MTSRRRPSFMPMTIALLVAGGCRGAEHAPAQQPDPSEGQSRPSAEPLATQAEAPSKEPVATLDEIWLLYDEAEGKPDRLGPVRAKLDRFLAEHPDDPQALLLLSQVQLEQGKMDESLATAERCIAIAADTAACWLTIGVITDIRDEKDRAIASYRRYIELAPDARYAPDARKALARLGSAPAAPGASAKVADSRDEKAMKALIDARTPVLRVCYTAVLETRPELAGKITYTVGIDPLGRVLGVAIDEDTVGDAKVAACTKAKIKGWRFPQAEDSGEVTFTMVYEPT